MRYASVCSGVEAATLAWRYLGWEPVWFSEIEPFPCAVLKERFPNVPNLGDMTEIKGENYHGAVDLLVGGTPCQGFSTAFTRGGASKGLAHSASCLALSYCRLLESMRPRWFVWENVPGVFSSNGGADFETLLKTFNECGYSCAWRVLDAQYVRVDGFPRAVPQHRSRVFVVGHRGSWHYPAAVLFEPDCLPRNTPPVRIEKEEDAEDFFGIGVRNIALGGRFSPTLTASDSAGAIIVYSNRGMLRRLMPLEYERLMGFPDNWTRIPWKGKPAEECPDAPRYKACGNSMCVNVMRWIGMRIENVERRTRND